MSETREPYGKATEVKYTLCSEGWRLYGLFCAKVADDPALGGTADPSSATIRAWDEYTAHKKDCPICSQRKAE